MNLLFAATSREVQGKDITGKYLTPYDYVNNVVEKVLVGNDAVARELWQRSKRIQF